MGNFDVVTYFGTHIGALCSRTCSNIR